MIRHVLAGVFLAVLATLTVLLSGVLGAEVQGVALLGAALGGALGLVPDRTPAQRAGAFAAGFAAAWIGYLLRAALLPDAPSGRAVAVLVVVLVCLAVGAGTGGKLPLWATLLGAAAMAGSYEAPYAADPSGFATTSPVHATAVLLTAGAGFLATALLGPVVQVDRETERRREVAERDVRHLQPVGAAPAEAAPAPAPVAAPAPRAPATPSSRAVPDGRPFRPFESTPEA
ncbi:hypothetical protein Cfla_0274 [Cellulomonas flavigena DSM 20109]|uniref:Uncharacterized protein n=1 Tax=Cellulomonas flavigena (strain ATCC 482 / DSM 20109 / BCRC 11376 / JCM 18109 / NBRC 3775 / NCIMB 8073 / NRS 134) TaxID=446466 RepID=D5UGZ0_CELFN|nr:hypothetical protein [Cellulomonas flavigena]ADG73193.1 hypothetical protein Cfla_0274 [Cellulomonas flavigena DSM 20109]